MNSNLSLDFSVNKQNKTISVKRAFAADLPLVWSAWTTPELLDLWWAPKPYRTKTKSMDFREGGCWLYAMLDPDNNAHWCKADYKKIAMHKSYSALDAFCDEAGNINLDFPRSLWTNSFTEHEGSTTVDILIEYKELADLEKIIGLGFKEGFTAALGNLDQYIEAQFKLRAEMRKDNATRVLQLPKLSGQYRRSIPVFKSVFKTEFNGNGIQRFGDLPADADHPPIADAVKKMVLHIELPIIGNHVLMGTDAPKEMGMTVVPGNNMHISLEPETREETKRILMNYLQAEMYPCHYRTCSGVHTLAHSRTGTALTGC